MFAGRRRLFTSLSAFSSISFITFALASSDSVSSSKSSLETEFGSVAEDARKASIATYRTLRTLNTAALCAADYKFNFPSDPNQAKYKSEIHLRNANRLLHLFQSNKGIYIKLGQHMSALQYILPPEYCNTLSVLQNEAPQSTFEEVQSVFAEETGKSIDELFSFFDPVPLGAASLAQVHKGTLLDGTPVAVKIQHADLLDFAEGDIKVVDKAVKAVKRLFPEFELDWLADEMKINLPLEMNFDHEAENARKVRNNFKNSSMAYIPAVHWSTRRILVMEYASGHKVTDIEYIHRANINPKHISAALNRIFSEMIFIHGFVHCDPHPGNIFVQRVGNFHWIAEMMRWYLLKKPNFKIILLDHGLYRTLSPEFRQTYARLWKAILEGSESDIKEYSTRLGGGRAYRLFSCILTHRSWTAVSSGSTSFSKSKQETEVILSRIPSYLPEVASLLAQVPRPLLLLFKTNDLIRSIDSVLLHEYGYSNSFTIMLRYCLKIIKEDEMKDQNILIKIAIAAKYLWLHAKVKIYEICIRFYSLRASAVNINNKQ